MDIKKQETKIRVTFNLDESVVKRMKKAKKDENINKSYLVNELLKQYFKNK